MIRVAIDLLGPPDVRWQGQRLGFRTRRALALLAYLAASEAGQPRDRLAALFWPESDPPARRAMLRTTLQHLRHALAPVTDPGLVLRADNDVVSVVRDAVDLDLDIIAEAERALRATGQGDHSALLATLRAATERLRGEFMQGFTLGDLPDFDRWIGTQQQHWRERVGRICDAFIRLAAESGDTTAALGAALRWAAADPLNETAIDWQMRLRFIGGDPIEALRLFDAYRAALARDLGAQPGAALSAFAARIRAETPPATGVAPRSPAPRLQRTSDRTPPLVGRADELGRLIAVLQRFRERRPQVVLLTGEAGIGKTRLARELLRHATADRLDTWEARAFEAVERISYQVVLDALRPRVDRENAPDSLLSDVWLAELSRLLPELRERYPDLPPPLAVGESEAQTRLFEAVARLAQACALRSPVVLFVDDAQWADPASLDLLHYVARQCAARRVPFLLLATARAEELSSPALAAWIAALGRTLPLTTLHLEALTAAHTHHWVQALAGYRDAAPPETVRLAIGAFSAWLHAETSGQPFFMQEMIRTMRERGLLGPDTEPEARLALDPETAALAVRDREAVRVALGIPEGVRDIVRARTQRLSPQAAELLAAAATVGTAANFDDLRAIAALDEREGLRALDDVLDARLFLVDPSDEVARYLITHDKVREVIYASTRGERRRALHRRAFDHLRQAAPTPAATLAYHAVAAGLRDEAARWSIRAGDEAMAVFDTRRACAYYEDADERLGGVLERVDATAYLRLARAQELCGQGARAEETYARLLQVASATSDLTLEATALSRLAILAMQALDEPRMHALIARIVAATEHASDPHLQANAAWTMALIYIFLTQLEPARAHGERAVALAKETGDEELVARCLNVLAYTYNNQYEGRLGLAVAEESARRYAALGNTAMASDSLAQVASAAMRLGQPQQAVSVSRQARERVAAVENNWGVVNSDVQLAVALAEAGALGEAHAAAVRALELAQEQQIAIMIPTAQITLAAVLRYQLRFAEARTLLDQLQQLPLPRSLADRAALELCATCASLGDWPAAHALVHALLDRQIPPFFLSGRAIWLEVEALCRGGDEDRVATYLQHLDAAIADSPRARLDYDRALAHWLLKHDPTQAIALLRKAAATAATLGLPVEQWGILAALCAAYRTTDNQTAATATAAHATSIISQLAASLTPEANRHHFLTNAQAILSNE